jgi:hypothetical protein
VGREGEESALWEEVSGVDERVGWVSKSDFGICLAMGFCVACFFWGVVGVHCWATLAAVSYPRALALKNYGWFNKDGLSYWLRHDRALSGYHLVRPS